MALACPNTVGSPPPDPVSTRWSRRQNGTSSRFSGRMPGAEPPSLQMVGPADYGLRTGRVGVLKREHQRRISALTRLARRASVRRYHSPEFREMFSEI